MPVLYYVQIKSKQTKEILGYLVSARWNNLYYSYDATLSNKDSDNKLRYSQKSDAIDTAQSFIENDPFLEYEILTEK